MTRDEHDLITAALTMIGDDAVTDAKKPVPFTTLGIGTIHGEMLAMIHALAAICRQLLDAVPIDNDPDGLIEAAAYEEVMSYDAYGSH